MDELIERAAELVVAHPPLVVFTGAGVSTESGIPDFRSPTGIWARYDPEDFSYQRFLASEEGRRRYWALGRELYRTVRDAEPNPAHHALAELERLGLLDCVITQNIDNLHQRAGTSPERVIELHGNATRARCLGCGRPYPRDELQARLEAGEAVPDCLACGGIVKPHTVLFGEPMPPRETREAEMRSRAAGAFLVVGSSLVVFPAAYMPLYAREEGAKLVIVNLSPTPLDHLADVVIAGRAGEVMARLVARVRVRLGDRAAPAP
ncbi:MAG: NAD-dependent deacylase [Armatimonadota bacterium]|nr:NAD-dependent deacylase [Armatimonadota bacterium]MDR7492260.1 NAD-dependent deacylase [Armatimonadota bacterium]MDR7593200.1 NAD-dependent deacylase [Armatimonadota bacterium]